MTDKVDYLLASSEQIVTDLGNRVERLRLASNITQANLADKAGIGVRTVARLEGGQGATLDTFVRVLQALGLQSHLEAMLPDPDIRPMERIHHRGIERRRASAAQPARPSVPFRWGKK